MGKPRVMYLLRNFPQISETYIKTEIEAVRDDHEVRVIALRNADLPHKNHFPFRLLDDVGEIREAIEEFKPHVLHSHWLHSSISPKVFALSQQTSIPFTIRAHSFDLQGDKHGRTYLERFMASINDDLCLGILTFPWGRRTLEAAGIRAEKIFDCYPVVDYRRFHDRGPNGEAIMNVGACLPKKKMEDFLELGAALPHIEFNLYAMGYKVDKLRERNEAMGRPVNFLPAVEPEDMPAEYKKHRWIVYTASKDRTASGWPMAIAEAQASGVGVCMANLRPDLREYVGPAGFLYDSIYDVIGVVSKPFPEELRAIGFEQAKKSDIADHKVILTDLWRRAFTAGD